MLDFSFIFGLGNPGKEYERTRHNLGWMVVDFLMEKYGCGWEKGGENILISRCKVSSESVKLIRSKFYMNNSGDVLDDIEGITPGSLFVICDDMSLPLGSIRIRMRGGSGGHKGLESIIMALGSEEFPRMRLGIGEPPPGVDAVDFVLSPFLDEELPLVKNMIVKALEAIEVAADRGIQEAMQRFNRRIRADGSE